MGEGFISVSHGFVFGAMYWVGVGFDGWLAWCWYNTVICSGAAVSPNNGVIFFLI